MELIIGEGLNQLNAIYPGIRPAQLEAFLDECKTILTS